MDFDWKGAVRAIAPGIATALGGPLAGNAVTFLENAVLGPDQPKGDEKTLAAAIQGATPEQLLAIKKADQDFTLAMQKLGVDLEQIASADRASARQREMAVRDYVPGILALGVTAGFFGVLGFMLLRPVPQGGHDALLVMLGSLGTAWAAIIAYYFGSSSGDAHKTELLAKAPAIKG